jgi:hypothetical protein
LVEAFGLLHLLQKAKLHLRGAVPLLIFINCPALLMILKKWRQSDFCQWPDPCEGVHFDIIFPQLQEPRAH